MQAREFSSVDIDFVADCSARLPMLTIMEMLGVPTADQPAVAKAAEKLFSMSDHENSSIEERARVHSIWRAHPICTSASAAAAHISAWATSWPRPSYETCSANF